MHISEKHSRKGVGKSSSVVQRQSQTPMYESGDNDAHVSDPGGRGARSPCGNRPEKCSRGPPRRMGVTCAHSRTTLVPGRLMSELSFQAD